MKHRRLALVPGTCLLVLTLAAPALCSISGSAGPNARIAVAEAPATPVPVAKWDPASPQELVRIEGALYQKDAGFFYRVIEDRITVRLAEGVTSWRELLERSLAAAPQAFGILEALTPERSNRLAIIDLIIPDGSPTYWAERVFETGLVRYAEVATYGVYLVTPNDSLYTQQWALNNTGQTGGTPGADLHAEEAWDVTTGDPAVIVGVLDSGTMVTHPDLVLNTWINEDEIPDNGQDDDDNGYIDDWRGWDFGNNNNDPHSNSFHGTHVTGIINAATGNGTGIAGLAGGLNGPGVRTIAAAVGESGPIGSVLDDAILYAADNGARVITMSLTVGTSGAINDALDYAYNTADVFIDCAAGNSGSSVGYPANRPEVAAVASTDHNDNRSSFSNPGPELEVSAPGSNILSTQLGGSYGTSSGTSFAAPYCAAVAALIRSVGPGLSAPEVRQLLMDTADDLGTPGHDTLTGWGRLNAYEAVTQAGFSDGTVGLNADLYSCSDQMTVTVTDFDLGSFGLVPVTFKSDVEPGGEVVQLSSIGFGVFTGTIALSGDAPANDGILQATHEDTLIVEYLDEDNGQGGLDVLKTASATTDCLGPQISNVASAGVSDSSARIMWNTDEAGTGLVRYGTDVPPDQEVSSGSFVVDHVLPLSDLEECTTYKFEVESADGFDNVVIDDNGGAFHTFQTLGDFPGVGLLPCQTGQALLDRNTYGCSSTAAVTVTDIDLDKDSGVADVTQVLMTSTSEPAGEWITLTELSNSSGMFEGTIALGTGTPASDGLLTVAAGDLITVTYFDEDDGQGRSQVSTDVSTADCQAPSISDVRATAISSTRTEIEWTTDEPATSRVEFGPDALLGSVVEDLELKMSHNVPISAFEACDRVFFRVVSADENGDLLSVDAGGQPFELNLNRIGGLVYHDNFEVQDGWTLEGEWERGTPQGQGSGSGDPGLAFSGSGVIGNDLSGSGAHPGDYEPDNAEWAFSPVFNTLGETELELILRRKLGVNADHFARILVQGLFAQMRWTNSGAVDDTEWTEVRYAIPTADNSTSVRIGFGINASSGSPSFGWNIDEIIVKDSTEPDYLTCGGCAGAPTFGGLTSAHDPAPCAVSGLTLQWDAAPAWGTGTGGTYDVHRGTTSNFIPGAGNRVASGLTGTTWTDNGAPLDTEVWYVVRARSDEDCTGGEGLADGNLVRLSATETIGQPPAAGVGSTLQVTSVGGAHVRLTWDPAIGADHYIVRRSVFPDFGSAEEIGTPTGMLFEDVNVAFDGNLYFYKVFSANACGEETP